MMENLEDTPLYDISEEENESHAEVLERYRQEEFGSSKASLGMIVPSRLVHILIVMALFLARYYYFNCDRSEDGSMTSKPLYLPMDVKYNPLAFILSFLEEKSS